MASTITLQQVANWCSTQTELIPLIGVGGYSSEPFMTIANDAMSDIINTEHDWIWNKNELSPATGCFVTRLNQQDYLFAGAASFTLSAGLAAGSTASAATIDLASNSAITVSAGVVTVNTLETVRYTVGDTVYLLNVQAKSGNAANAAKYNATYTDNGNSTAYANGFVITAVGTNSFSFASVAGMNSSDVLGAAGITDFSWLQSAQMMESNLTMSPPYIRILTARRNLVRARVVADPEYVSVEQDLGTGVIKVRLNAIPGAVAWNIGLTYQKQPPLLTSMTQTFSPIPDHYRALIYQAILYRCYRHKGDQREDAEYQKLQAMIMKSTGADNAAESNIYLEPVEQLADLPGPFWIGY